jgi:hypothetical protein
MPWDCPITCLRNNAAAARTGKCGDAVGYINRAGTVGPIMLLPSTCAGHPFFGNLLKRGHRPASPPASWPAGTSREDAAASSAKAAKSNDRLEEIPFPPAAALELFNDFSDRIVHSPRNRHDDSVATHPMVESFLLHKWHTGLCGSMGKAGFYFREGFHLFCRRIKAADRGQVITEAASARAPNDPSCPGRRRLHSWSAGTQATSHRVTALVVPRHTGE